MPAMSLEGLPCAWLGITWPQLRTGFHGGMGGEGVGRRKGAKADGEGLGNETWGAVQNAINFPPFFYFTTYFDFEEFYSRVSIILDFQVSY